MMMIIYFSRPPFLTGELGMFPKLLVKELEDLEIRERDDHAEF